MTPEVLAGRYRLIEPVEDHNTAEVWRAEDLTLGRQVAVKVLTPPPSIGDAAAQNAWREARRAARLTHPNLVSVYDVDIDDGFLFLVMEWVGGESLATSPDALSPAHVAAVGAQLARALAALHAAGMVHRDVTPGNVFLLPDGAVKLTDFGLGRLSPGTGDRPPSPAGDLHSLGHLVYELLTGEPAGPAPDSVDGAPPELERLTLSLLTGDETAEACAVAESFQSVGDELFCAERAAAPEPAKSPSRPHPSATLAGLAALSGAVLVIALVTGLMAVMAPETSGGRTPVMAATSQAPAPQVTAVNLAGATQTARADSPGAALLAALVERLTRQAGSGQLDGKVAEAIGRHTHAIGDALARNRSGDVAPHVTEIRAALDAAARTGRWIRDRAVLDLLDRLAART